MADEADDSADQFLIVSNADPNTFQILGTYDGGWHRYLQIDPNGGVKLYHDVLDSSSPTPKLYTTSAGVNITGNLGVSETTLKSKVHIYESTNGVKQSVLRLDAHTDTAGDGAFIDFGSRWGGNYPDWVVGRIGGSYYTGTGSSGSNRGALEFMTADSDVSATGGVNGCTTRMVLRPDGDLSLESGNLVVSSGKGIDFSANAHESSMSSELFDGYEEGTFTPTIWKGGTQSSLTTSLGKYIKVAGVVHFSFYCFRAWDSSGLSNGSEIWQVGFPFTVIGGNGGAWSFFPAGYCRVNSAGPTDDQQIRWQSNSNSGTKLTLYSSNNTTNWTSGYIEFSGSGTAYLS
tara:strand:- start:58 stop:1092 length:1035 start_codon:yes stop_codon:yes gene_type:complete